MNTKVLPGFPLHPAELCKRLPFSILGRLNFFPLFKFFSWSAFHRFLCLHIMLCIQVNANGKKLNWTGVIIKGNSGSFQYTNDMFQGHIWVAVGGRTLTTRSDRKKHKRHPFLFVFVLFLHFVIIIFFSFRFSSYHFFFIFLPIRMQIRLNEDEVVQAVAIAFEMTVTRGHGVKK